jgi:hypothetical protein
MGISRRNFLMAAIAGAGAFAFSATSVSSSDPIYILASGQSNTYGNGPGGAWDISPLVKVWNNANNHFDLADLGTGWITPVYGQKPFRANSNNQSVQAANFLARLTGRPVQLIMTAYDAQSISKWHDGTATGPMYARTMAILAAAGVTNIDWFLWNQGSGDEDTTATYAIRWDAFIAQLTADGVISADTPIVTNETAHAPLINKVLQQIADADPRCEMAKIGHLPTVEGIHFTGPALVRSGWEAVYSLAKTQTEFYGLVPVQDLTGWVIAAPENEITFAHNTVTDVPLVARYGDLSLINDDGDFVATIGGLWEFSVSGFANGGRTLVALFDENGDQMPVTAYSGPADAAANTPIVFGSDVFNIPQGGKISMHIRQSSGGAKTVSETQARGYIRLMAKYLGANPPTA